MQIFQYRENTLLVPLGDDFRYNTQTEWDDQYTNYKMLFEHMNSKPELNIHVRFFIVALCDLLSNISRRVSARSTIIFSRLSND